MWIYEKRLIFPLKHLTPNPRMAKLIAMLNGGPNGEISAGLQYLNQRYYITNEKVKAVLTDIGTEELSHSELLSVMFTQLMCNAPKDQLRASNMDGWSAAHDYAAFPQDWNGNDWTAAYIQTTGDPIADLTTDMAAEECARAGYEGVLKQCDDPDIIAPLQFLRMREIVHYQRFGEALNILNEDICRKKWH